MDTGVIDPFNPWSSTLVVERSDADGVRFAAVLPAHSAADILARIDGVRRALESEAIVVPAVADQRDDGALVHVSFEPLPGLAIVEPGNQVEAIVGGLGRTLAAIHGVVAPQDVPALPAQHLADLAAAVGRSRTEPLDRPYERQTPERLAEIVVERVPEPATPSVEHVLCHGAFGVNAVVVAGNDAVGIAPPVCAVVADRHLDLATLFREAAGRLPAELMPQLLDAYGAGPDTPNPIDPGRLDWFDLARSLAQPQ